MRFPQGVFTIAQSAWWLKRACILQSQHPIPYRQRGGGPMVTTYRTPL